MKKSVLKIFDVSMYLYFARNLQSGGYAKRCCGDGLIIEVDTDVWDNYFEIVSDWERDEIATDFDLELMRYPLGAIPRLSISDDGSATDGNVIIRQWKIPLFPRHSSLSLSPLNSQF